MRSCFRYVKLVNRLRKDILQLFKISPAYAPCQERSENTWRVMNDIRSYLDISFAINIDTDIDI